LYKAKKNKLSNRNRILECIYRNAPISRIDIAELTDITPATVTLNVTTLISEGIIRETGEASTEDIAPGRKKILIDLNPDYAYSIGIEFTQKALVLCITNIKGTIIVENNILFTANLALNITGEIISHLHQLIEVSGLPMNRFIGIGIGVPGHMDSTQQKIVTNNPLWASFQPDLIREAFSLPVILENNVRCMALSEYLFRPNSSPDNFAFFHVSLGMYCANIIDGEIFVGNNYVSGEIGHSIANANGRRCECGKYGCLQTISGERWLLNIAQLLYENDKSTLLKTLVQHKDDITIEHIATAYEMGDPAISTYISEALKALGITASNIAIYTSPEKIFLHGQLFNNKAICNELMDFIMRQLLFVDSTSTDSFEILPYSLSDGSIGASALSLLHFLIRGHSLEEQNE
jgi:predicted NBD/HSP70 family sugar kinase